MPARKSRVGPSSRRVSPTWDQDTTPVTTRMRPPGRANTASDKPIGRTIAPTKAMAKAATDSASVTISLKFSRRATAPGHGDMRDAVLVEGFAGYRESEPLVPRT